MDSNLVGKGATEVAVLTEKWRNPPEMTMLIGNGKLQKYGDTD